MPVNAELVDHILLTHVLGQIFEAVMISREISFETVAILTPLYCKELKKNL